jgi:predicted neutral ceramidase superfamily lipid hydrolase
LWGALVGVVAVPSRLVPQAFQSSWLAMTALTLLVVAVGLAFVAVVTRALGRAGVPERLDAPREVALDVPRS